MTRTLGVTAAIVFAALLFVQFASVVVQPRAVVSSSADTTATIAPAEATAPDIASQAINDLAAWPMAAGR
jgi:hypothetical protein